MSVVTLRGDGLFESGSATLPRATCLADRASRTHCKVVPGKVQVTGHTDSQPIRSVRFPSNWHLSEARARGVAADCAGGAAERLSAEGRADAEPIA